MASQAVLAAVKARQQANWTTVPVYWPNTTVKPPATGAFVTVETPVGRSELETLGGAPTRRWLEEGGFRFVIHVGLGTGTDVAFTYADELAALFRGVEWDDIDLQTWAPGPAIPLGEDGGFYKVSFSVPNTYRHYA